MTEKTLIVTGAFGALGREAVRKAAAAGWRVAALDAGPSAPEGLLDPAGHLILGGVDLTDAGAAKAAIDAAAAKLGRIDALVNIAGGFTWETLLDGDPASWERMFALNVKTTLNACRAAAPHLAASGAGAIVNIGANGALKAAAGMGAYAASKSGVHRLTEALAEELKASDVTVNAVLPSIIDTPRNRADMPNADHSRWVRPEALAKAVMFLASDAASAVTGAALPVRGRV